MIVTAKADFRHGRAQVRAGQQINIVSSEARELRARGLVTWGEQPADPLPSDPGALQSASPAVQAAPQTTSIEFDFGDSLTEPGTEL